MKPILISIVVITYNFEKIIEKCLISIENQTYKNVEIIITDDCSTDKTIEICEKWKEKNINQFEIKIIKLQENSGVVKNINNGVKQAKGEWVKIIAGDDFLDKNAIKKFVDFIFENPKAEIIFSKANTFYIENGEELLGKIIPENTEFYKKKSKQQYQELLEGNMIVAPTAIIKNELLKRMNYFDEKFKMVEDYPFWLKLLKSEIKFYFLNEVTVFYRKDSNSVSGKGKNKRTNPAMLEFSKQFYNEIYSKEVKSIMKKWDKKIEIKRKEIILKNNNKSSFLSQSLRFLEIKILKKYIKRFLLFILLYLLFKYLKK